MQQIGLLGKGAIKKYSFSENRKLIAASTINDLSIFKTDNFLRISSRKLDNNLVSLAISNFGSSFWLTTDGYINIWQKEIDTVTQFKPDGYFALKLVSSADGKIIFVLGVENSERMCIEAIAISTLKSLIKKIFDHKFFPFGGNDPNFVKYFISNNLDGNLESTLQMGLSPNEELLFFYQENFSSPRFLYLWHAESGEEKIKLDTSKYGHSMQVGFSKDSKQLILEGENFLIIDIETQSVKSIPFGLNMPETINKLMNERLKSRQETEKLIKLLPGYTTKFCDIAFTSDDKSLLCVGTDSRVWYFDTETESKIKEVNLLRGSTHSLQVEHGLDNNTFVWVAEINKKYLIAADSAQKGLVWDISNECQILEIKDVVCGDYLQDKNSLVLVNQEGIVSVYSTITFQDAWHLSIDRSPSCMAFSRDQKYLIIGCYATLVLLDFDKQAIVDILVTPTEDTDFSFQDNGGKIYWVNFKDDSCVLYRNHKGVYAYNLAERKTEIMISLDDTWLKGNPEFHGNLDYSTINSEKTFPENNTLFSSNGNCINVFSTKSFKQIEKLNIPNIRCIASTKDQKLIAFSGDDGAVYLWEI